MALRVSESLEGEERQGRKRVDIKVSGRKQSLLNVQDILLLSHLFTFHCKSIS